MCTQHSFFDLIFDPDYYSKFCLKYGQKALTLTLSNLCYGRNFKHYLLKNPHAYGSGRYLLPIYVPSCEVGYHQLAKDRKHQKLFDDQVQFNLHLLQST